MIVFPAIDIQNGRVVRLRQGVAGAGKEYFEDPVEAARKWCDEGALFLHVVDLDGAFAGEPKNRNIIRRICESVEIPVEVGGGIRTEEDIEEYLNNGVSRVILGSKAAEDQHFLVEAARQYASSLAVSLDARNDVVATHGWVDGSDKKVIPFALFLLSIGIRTLIYTDIRRDGMLTGLIWLCSKNCSSCLLFALLPPAVSVQLRISRLYRQWGFTAPSQGRPFTKDG